MRFKCEIGTIYVYFADIYSLEPFDRLELVNTVFMGYLCIDNREILTMQPRNINPKPRDSSSSKL